MRRRESLANGTELWAWRFDLGRLKVGVTLMQHTSHLPDRWVLQPEVVYDRKRRGRMAR